MEPAHRKAVVMTLPDPEAAAPVQELALGGGRVPVKSCRQTCGVAESLPPPVPLHGLLRLLHGVGLPLHFQRGVGTRTGWGRRSGRGAGVGVPGGGGGKREGRELAGGRGWGMLAVLSVSVGGE